MPEVTQQHSSDRDGTERPGHVLGDASLDFARKDLDDSANQRSLRKHRRIPGEVECCQQCRTTAFLVALYEFVRQPVPPPIGGTRSAAALTVEAPGSGFLEPRRPAGWLRTAQKGRPAAEQPLVTLL